VGVYGAGRFSNRTHLPNLTRLDGVEVVAVCDVNPEALKATAEAFGIPATYADGHEMLEKEVIDALYSVVPAYARSDMEVRAAEKGIHLFSEKPQAVRMAVARRIDDAVRKAGVLSTVGFRERYRPLFQEARRLLEDKEIVHARFILVGGPPGQPSPEQRKNWNYQIDKAGGRAFDWGVHAVDYTRFMTAQEIVSAQAFYYQRLGEDTPRSASFNLLFSSDATMTMNFVAADPQGPCHVPWFSFYFEGGRLEIYRYDRIELNGETVYQGETFDPWLEQSRVFIEAVRSGDGSAILNDYHDGLYSLAPVLAGWESARRGGECIEVGPFMEA
jgi:predicted dehydrogenase